MSDLLDFSPPGQATFSLAGAKARFYDAGTTTPRTVYADEAETVPHPSPLLADSSGRFAQAFVSGGAVKVVVTQSDDSTGYTLDPCVKVAATGSAASSISFTPSVLRPFTNVQDAIDDGTFPARTITAGAGISVTNGDGASGNPTIAADIASLAEAQAGTSSTKLMTPERANDLLRSFNINLGTAVASTSGTAVDFTGIPSWVDRVTISLNLVSTNGTANLTVTGGNGSFETSGYSSNAATQGGATASSTAAFIIANAVVANASFTGAVTLTRYSGNTWVMTGTLADTQNTTMRYCAGIKSFGGALERLRITTAGADTFDAGGINIAWE